MSKTWNSTRLACVCWACLTFVATAGEKPIVFVSIPAQAWLVKQLAGETLEVRTFLAVGGNPHSFEPTAHQIKRLAQANLYFTIGIPFETALTTRAAKLNTALKISAMDRGIEKLGAYALQHDHAANDHACMAGGDPHIWLAPQLMAVMASNAVATLTQVFPQDQAALSQRLRTIVSDISALDAEIRERLKPLTIRTWMVTHPSWRYFAHTYGLTLLVLEQDGKAPTARHLAQMIQKATESKVALVFAEPQFDPQPARTLARQIGARVMVIDPLREDWPALMREVAETLSGRASSQPHPKTEGL